MTVGTFWPQTRLICAELANNNVVLSLLLHCPKVLVIVKSGLFFLNPCTHPPASLKIQTVWWRDLMGWLRFGQSVYGGSVTIDSCDFSDIKEELLDILGRVFG